MTSPKLPDQAARDTARSDTARSLAVEASAGTGKTTTLVHRVLHLVLEDGVPLGQVAALTFTEKAAGEMKVRLSEALDERIAELSTGGPASERERRLERARRGRRDLEAAEVGTIHAFCARLLRERPVEAGLPPDFVFPEQSVARDLAREAFDDWVSAEARVRGSAVHDVLASGAGLAALRALALLLYEERAALAGAALPGDILEEARLELRGLAQELLAVLDQASPEERLGARGYQARQAAGELVVLAGPGLDELVRFAPATPLRRKSVSPGQWQGDLGDRLHDLWDRFKALPARLGTLPLEPLLVRLVRSLEVSFFASLEERKRRRGFLDFDDLLLEARGLLRRSPAAREHFRRRYTTLIVDEFQDTDPLQAEVVLRLAAGEPQDPERWEELTPRPGALFLVGDPKQSIFRFRRADVETYRRVASRLPREQRVTLTTSFRSRPGILDYVNAVFSRVLVEDPARPWEVGYTPLEPPAAPTAAGGPAVLHLEPPPASEARLTLEDEARAVTNLLLSRLLAGKAPRPTAAILLPRNDHVEVYRRVLTGAGLPVSLEGGNAFYEREETGAVATALAAVDDPGDAVLVVATLKSFLFAATDLELVEAAEAGARFDDLTTIPSDSPLRPSADLLLELHRKRHQRPFHETLMALLDARAAFTALSGGAAAHGPEAVANVERLLVSARALDREGLSYPAAARRFLRRLDDREAEPRAGEDERDAVRLTTIHKAKGLEFDVVVVAGLGFDEPGRAPDGGLVSDHAGGGWGVELTLAGQAVRTPGFARLQAAHALRRDAELKRLLYVAFTRARKTLAVSWFRELVLNAKGEVRDDLAKTVLGRLSPAAAEVAPSLVERVAADLTRRPRKPEQAALGFPPDLTPELARLAARRERLEATSSRALRRAGEHAGAGGAASAEPPPGLALAVETPEDLPAPDRTGAPSGRALRVGIAVHAAMERLLAPEGGGDDLEPVVAHLAQDEAAEVRRLVRTLQAHPVTARALAARRRFVELPILFRDQTLPEAPLVEGKIDLLFEEADGFTLVDWKTDRVDSADERAALELRYAPQLAAYARALEAVLGEGVRVKETTAVFARLTQ